MGDAYPPIENIETFDIVGVRKDGGIDAVVVCSGPLDGSPQTIWLLGVKVRNYLKDIASDGFRECYGGGPVRILICCEHLVSAAAQALVEALQAEAAGQDVQLQLVATVA
jgi:hypothetical protein